MLFLGALGAAVLVLVLLAVVDLLRIRGDLERGKKRLKDIDFATVDREGGVRHVAEQAAADLRSAADRAEDSPWLSALAGVPLFGDQVAGLRDLTHAAERAGDVGVTAASEVQAALDRAGRGGPAGRVALVDEVTAALDRLQAGLRTIDVGPDRFLPPLASARDDFVDDLRTADGRLDEGRQTLATLRGFLVGPRRYLVLGGNNSEMRTMGIATTSGVATVQNGAVSVGDFVYSAITSIGKPGIRLPEGWDYLYGFLDAGSWYSNDTASPNFDRTGAVAAEISRRNVWGPVDGVIYVDTLALQSLLSVVGPVTVDGITYDETNAAAQLINRNYFTYTGPDQSQRREAQGRVAKAIFDTLNTREVPLLRLATTLQSLAEQRHLAAWSASPDEEKLWHDVGADGTRAPNDLLVSSQELGTSKLDYYVTNHVDMLIAGENGHRRVDLTVTVTNPARTESSPYIDGGSMYAKPGEYGYYLTVFLPRDAFAVTPKDPSWNVWARDGDLQAVTFIANAPMGTSRSISLSFALPASVEEINIVPSARINPTTWRWVGQDRFDDREPLLVNITRIAPDPVTVAGWLVAGLLVFAAGLALTGDAWGRGAMASDAVGRRRAAIDGNLGWWLCIAGVAMVIVQLVLFTLR